MSLDISKVNNVVEITTDTQRRGYATPNAEYLFLSSGVLYLKIGDDKFESNIADLTIQGVAPTDEDDAYDKLSLVFPNANSGSGGSGLTSVAHDDTLTGDGVTPMSVTNPLTTEDEDTWNTAATLAATALQSVSIDSTTLDGDAVTTPLAVKNPVTVDEINLWNDAASLAAGGTNRVVSGNAIWNTGLTFDIVGTIYSNLVYYILGTRYESSPTQVTLSAADPDNARIDVIYFDTLGAVGVLEGTPSADPVKPVVDSDTQVELTHVTVPANATEPVISGNLTVYDENTEFTGASTNGTVNFAATTAPSSGTKHISCGAFTNNQNINLTDGSLHDSTLYQNLTFKLRLNATFATNTYLGFYFANGTSPVSNQVTVQNNTFGYVRTVTGSYQVVSIPMSAFVFTNTQFNRIYIVLHGTNATGFYLDAITLQGGVTVSASNGVQSFNSRTGNIIPQSGDYNISQITNGLSNTLTNARLFIGNGSNVATGVAMSGDASLSNAGALTVTGLRGASLPALAAGFYKYTGSAFTVVNPDTVVNVLDYGADSTGVTDSTAAINSAKAVAVSTGKKLYAPTGTYLVTAVYLQAGSGTNKKGIELATGLEFFGDGIGKTIIKLADAVSATTANSYFYPIINAHGCSNCIVHDLEINGNKANQGNYNSDPVINPTGYYADPANRWSTPGIMFKDGDHNEVYNVYVHDSQNTGIYAYNSTNNFFHHCKCVSNGESAITLHVNSTGRVENVLATLNNSDQIRFDDCPNGGIIKNCEASWSGSSSASTNWYAGIYFSGTTTKNVLVDGCYVHDNSAYGIDTGSNTNIRVVNCVIDQNGNGGIVSVGSLTAKNNQITNNGKKSDGVTDTHSNYNPAAIVMNSASNNIIEGNWCTNTTTSQTYFIKSWGGGGSTGISKSTVVNNYIKGVADLAHLYDGDDGTNNIFNNRAFQTDGTTAVLDSTAGYVLTLQSNGTYKPAAVVASSLAMSGLTAATGNSTINNGANTIEWDWNSLTTGPALKLSSNSTATSSGNQYILDIALSGAAGGGSQNSYGIRSQVTKTGAGAPTNIAAYLSASGGTNNYGLIVASGLVGLGTATPSDVNGSCALKVVGTTGTDVISASDGTANAAIFIANAANVPIQFGSVSSGHKVGIFVGNQAAALIVTTNSATVLGANSALTEVFRTTNGGSDVNARFSANTGNSMSTAGSKTIGIDNANGLIFTAANGTRQIARAAIQITNLTNTAGSEVGDLILLTQSGGTAIGQKMRISGLGNIVLGNEAALSTSATDGFMYIPSCAGVPSGTPTSYTGKIAMVYDSTNNDLYAYNGAWKKVTMA